MKIPITITLVFPFLLLLTLIFTLSLAAIPPKLLLRGFSATPNPTVTFFQPLLSDSTGNFSLSFLRFQQHQLALAIIHVPSGESFWQANTAVLAQWSKHTSLFFNGSLVMLDHRSGVIWSTVSIGDRVVLTSAPNLQILKGEKSPSLLWQSFDFPSNTLVENQNFTSAMSLVSINGLYAMRLGSNFIGMYAKFRPNDMEPNQIYYRHRALQAKVEIIQGHGPILARISPDGYLGIYQNGTIPADVQSFNSYQRSVPGLRRLRIENDGNLKGYYWSGSSWILDYQAISETCELPSPCGLYGLCKPEVGCSCLDNRTQAHTGVCYSTQEIRDDLCGAKGEKFLELRRTGVELPYKELMSYTETTSYEECEKGCHMNCTCWGVLYNNASGFCYNVDYPIQTIVEAGHDESKLGYFKLRDNDSKKKVERMLLGIGIGLLCGAIFMLGFGGYKLWKRNRRVKSRMLDNEAVNAPGPYKDLRSSSGFEEGSSTGSVELSSR